MTHIGGKNPMNVSNGRKLSRVIVQFYYMKEITLQRDPMSVSSVVRPLLILVIFQAHEIIYIREKPYA
jgi:hypothetical protein